MPKPSLDVGRPAAPLPLQVLLRNREAAEGLHALALRVKLPRTEVIARLVALYGDDLVRRLTEPGAE